MAVGDSHLSVNISLRMKTALEIVAERTGVSVSDIVRMAIHEAINERTDVADILKQADEILVAKLSKATSTPSSSTSSSKSVSLN